MKAIIVILVCAVASCSSMETNAPPGADLAELRMMGTYYVGQHDRSGEGCEGVLPELATLKLGADGIAETESNGIHLSRWRPHGRGFVLTPLHAFAWSAVDDVVFVPDADPAFKGSEYSTVIEWYNASEGGTCIVPTSLTRVVPEKRGGD